VERTLIILKPDCTHRRLIGRIVQRFEDKGLVISAMKLMRIDETLAGKHYAPHQGKPFYPGLIEYITSGAGRGHGAGRAERDQCRAQTDGQDLRF
jgi:nucleoside-diphosphate kinase